MILVSTFILAFCSIVYELLLGQALSAFLGNTVLRFSVTIGLYMLSMGIGALLTEGRFVRNPVVTLLKTEILLTVTGGFCVLLLHTLDWTGMPPLLFSGLAHSLIILIGILTGAELPLLIELRRLQAGESDNWVLGIDYLGAFCGTLTFAFLFYPHVGLVATAFSVALLNALVGLGLVLQASQVSRDTRSSFRFWIAVQALGSGVLLICLWNARSIDEYFLQRYLGS